MHVPAPRAPVRAGPCARRRVACAAWLVLAAPTVLADARASPGAGPHAPVIAPVASASPGTTVVDGSGTGHGPVIERTRVPDDFPLPTLLDGPWRLALEWTLGRDGADLVLVDGRGVAARFAPERPLTDGTWRWVGADGATIDGGRGRHALRAADGTGIEFEGARPVSIRTPDGRTGSWRHEAGRPVAHTPPGGQPLRLVYERGALARIETAGGALRYAVPGPARRSRAPVSADRDANPSAPSWFGHCPADDRCDAESSPPGEAFARGPTIPGALALDVRPGHCDSHFAEPENAVRGEAIERGLAGAPPHAHQHPTVHDFPVVDFVGEDELVVVRSRDLARPAYDEPTGTALYERLMRDGRDVERLLLAPLRERGHVTATGPGGAPGVRRVDAEPPRRTVLELVVRHAMATPSQVRQIERARAALAERHGIELRVVEIP